MKIGFSSLCCPTWTLERMVSFAAEHGFEGLDLRGIGGELQLSLVPELAGDSDRTRSLFEDKKVELLCLGTSATLDSKKRAKLAEQKAALIESIELAGRLGCPFVRLMAGEVQKWDNYRLALSRVADVLRSMVPIATRWNVSLLVENSGDFLGSDAMWFLVDAVDHASVRCCWNQSNAKVAMERPTNSIPRLGTKIGMMHVCDATYDDQGVLLEYKPLGGGHAEVAKQVQLLKGVAYGGYLVFEWPKMWVPTLPEPDAALPEVANHLRTLIEEEQTVLTAYKGDKRPAKYATARPPMTLKPS